MEKLEADLKACQVDTYSRFFPQTKKYMVKLSWHYMGGIVEVSSFADNELHATYKAICKLPNYFRKEFQKL